MNGGRITGSKTIPSVVLAGAVLMFGDIDRLLCRHHQLADRGWRLRLLPVGADRKTRGESKSAIAAEEPP
jgi:hypothetical protein